MPPQVRARSLISSASRTAVWSFHSTNMALGLSANRSPRASGVPASSTAASVEAVVSMPMPMMPSRCARPSWADTARQARSRLSM